MPSFNEEHSEEIDYAIWKMRQKGIDPRSIAAQLRECEIFVSRKYINVALKRGVVLERRMAQHAVDIEQNDTIDNVIPDGSEPEEVEETSLESNHVPLEDSESGHDTAHAHISPAIEISVNESDSGDDILEDLVTVSSGKKHRRIKTTDDLVRRLEDDFRLYPDLKVKERASKFGIAVGTLCQIKHNILKMPKESGRTWKSTPQMVEDIAADMQVQPGMKVKDRARKFGISVGTLCRIMHDILEMPKRQVQRTGERKPRKPKEIPPATPVVTPWALKAIREEAGKMALAKAGAPKKPKRGYKSPKTMALPSQVQLRTDQGGQLVFLTFDPSTAAQLTGETNASIPISIASLPGSDELIWVVNPTSSEALAEEAAAASSGLPSSPTSDPTPSSSKVNS